MVGHGRWPGITRSASNTRRGVVEARANLLALANANHAAVRLYAGAGAHARRTGMRWPTGRLGEKLHE